MKLVKTELQSPEHPLDQHYRKLHCALRPLDHESYEFKVREMIIYFHTFKTHLPPPHCSLATLVKSKLLYRSEFLFTRIWEDRALSYYLARPFGSGNVCQFIPEALKFFNSAWSFIRVHIAHFFHSFSQAISQYLQSTHAPTHSDYTMTLLDVFEVEKEGEKEAFREDLHNRSQFSFDFGKTSSCLKCSYGT